jgi:hypothetical protein
MAPTPAPESPTGSSRSRTLNEPLKPVPAKRDVCWFWKTGKGCRYTAEECRDLHAYTTSYGEPANLHKDRPTWGSLADASPIVRHADPNSFTVPQVDHLSEQRKRGLTCWYWANHGKCEHSDEECRYLHEHAPKGVAPHPVRRFGVRSWRRKGGETGAEDGETVDGTVSGWGEAGSGWGEGDEGGNSGEFVLEEVQPYDSVSIGGWGVIGDGGAGGWGRDTPVQDNASVIG